MDILNLLIGTVLLRPYVFAFLACYLVIATLNMGVKRTVLFTLIAYTLAFLSEYSSTRNGFPYGLYHYIDTTRGQELWVSNVPFMDSLSYSFLVYVSYTMSLLIWSPLRNNGWDVRLDNHSALKHSPRVIVTAAALCMLLDVVIDPVAYRGDRWFLGKIYEYDHEGFYFGIPLTNFGGWMLVAAAILFCFTQIDRWLESRPGFRDFGMRDLPMQALLGPGVYFGVLAFNLGVAFYIGEPLIGLCGVGWTLAVLALVLFKIRQPGRFVSKETLPVVGE